MDKRDIEKLRLKTQMSEALHIVTTSPYQSLKDNASLKLKFLQEQYKGAFGEYSTEHLIEEKQKDNWEVKEAVRQDGTTFKVGDKYKDGNGETFTIDKMRIANNGKLMAHAKEGGEIDLFVVSKVK